MLPKPAAIIAAAMAAMALGASPVPVVSQRRPAYELDRSQEKHRAHKSKKVKRKDRQKTQRKNRG